MKEATGSSPMANAREPIKQAGYTDAAPEIQRSSQLQTEAGSLIASPLSMSDCRFQGHGSLRGRSCRRNIWFEAQALQGPQRVRNMVPSHRLATQSTAPSPRRAIRRILSHCSRQTDDHAAEARVDQRKGSPDRQMLWRITVSLRANATRAFPAPDRLAIARAQSFKPD